MINQRATEHPFTGKFNTFNQKGTYLCRQCGLALFRSDSKFSSSCGWPSFDDEIENAIKREPDQDGRRTEIVCQRCLAHLGHVFSGEGFTSKNLRHCVNSLSLDFVPDLIVKEAEEAIYAGGCFWGVEALLKQNKGVLLTEVGYSGGEVPYPSYEAVCSGKTGHYEAIRVLFDPNIINFETLTKDFLCIHDPTQSNGQGPDIGPRYQSAIFFHDDRQKEISENLINQLKSQHYQIATKLLPAAPFYKAEEYHQQYYDKKQQSPYCHSRINRFK